MLRFVKLYYWKKEYSFRVWFSLVSVGNIEYRRLKSKMMWNKFGMGRMQCGGGRDATPRGPSVQLPQARGPVLRPREFRLSLPPHRYVPSQ